MRTQALLLSAATFCLLSLSPAASVPVDQIPLSDASEKRLISLSETEAKWMTEEEVFGLIRANRKFIDITDGDLDFDNDPLVSISHTELPKAPVQQSIVKQVIDQISESYMKDFLTRLTGFTTRYYKTSSGKAASEWIFDQVQEEANKANAAGKGLNVSVTQFAHPWQQSSVIARIHPVASATEDDGIVIIGAHLDSVNQWNPYWGRSPGADDDGSGTTTTFEAFRLILEHGIVPSRPVEFHWYSAEEGGLLGSQKVVRKYADDGVKVVGMIQVDMTGYKPPNKKEIVGIATDFIDESLRKFLQTVAQEYCGIPWGDVKCGYGCSDHASWTRAGYPAAFTFEAPFDQSSPYVHTSGDDVSHISFSHMKEFVKLVLAFGIELGLGK
ncbi:hypothetical protein SpCBS45565_g05661 [Spizellomyces sp. 'palustris']|nr:hypothetical protein SpCBS45565_g05661 [Spizellomyces sp. 'palustris']